MRNPSVSPVTPSQFLSAPRRFSFFLIYCINPSLIYQFILPRVYSLQDLRRLRKRFLTLCRHIVVSPGASQQQLGDFFLEFLSKQGEMI